MNNINSHFVYFADKQIGEYIGDIKHNTIYPFFSNGQWAMHDLISWLLKQTGPADVQISTFSISEIAIRTLIHLSKIGMIKSIQCIFDNTIQKKKLQLLYFISQLTGEIYIAPNHSKVLLIKNDDWSISVISSANMTPNPRKEAGVISTYNNIFIDIQKKYNEFISESNKINNEII